MDFSGKNLNIRGVMELFHFFFLWVYRACPLQEGGGEFRPTASLPLLSVSSAEFNQDKENRHSVQLWHESEVWVPLCFRAKDDFYNIKPQTFFFFFFWRVSQVSTPGPLVLAAAGRVTSSDAEDRVRKGHDEEPECVTHLRSYDLLVVREKTWGAVQTLRGRDVYCCSKSQWWFSAILWRQDAFRGNSGILRPFHTSECVNDSYLLKCFGTGPVNSPSQHDRNIKVIPEVLFAKPLMLYYYFDRKLF